MCHIDPERIRIPSVPSANLWIAIPVASLLLLGRPLRNFVPVNFCNSLTIPSVIRASGHIFSVSILCMVRGLIPTLSARSLIERPSSVLISQFVFRYSTVYHIVLLSPLQFTIVYRLERCQELFLNTISWSTLSGQPYQASRSGIRSIP